MQAVRGSRARMAAHSAFFRSGTAPPAPPGARGSTAHTRSSGHGSTVTFRRILCSKRCVCSASRAELSHSRRKVGCSPGRSGSLRGEAGVAGAPRKCLCRPRAPAPRTSWPCGRAQHPSPPGGEPQETVRRGRTGVKQGLGATVVSGGQGEVSRHRRPHQSQNLPPPALRSTEMPGVLSQGTQQISGGVLAGSRRR